MTGASAGVARRQRAGRLNRRLGYVSLPLLVSLTVAYYLSGREGDLAHDISTWLQLILLPVFFVHVALSLYVFGVVPPRRTLRVFHIYWGYATFVVVIASQTTFGNEPLHTTLTVLMYLAIAVHIAIGLRYGVTRRATEVPRAGFSQPHAARRRP